MSLFATLVNIVSFFTLSAGLLSHSEVFAVQEAVRTLPGSDSLKMR